MVFVDASALVKRYVRERHSVTVRRLLAAGPVAVSRLSEVEVPSALARLVRERRLSSRARDGALVAEWRCTTRPSRIVISLLSAALNP